MDHVIPLARGGANSGENKVIACEYCNVMKSDLSKAEYLALLNSWDWTFHRMFATSARLYSARTRLYLLRRKKFFPEEELQSDRFLGLRTEWLNKKKRVIDKMIRRFEIRVASREFFQKRAVEIHDKFALNWCGGLR